MFAHYSQTSSPLRGDSWPEMRRRDARSSARRLEAEFCARRSGSFRRADSNKPNVPYSRRVGSFLPSLLVRSCWKVVRRDGRGDHACRCAPFLNFLSLCRKQRISMFINGHSCLYQPHPHVEFCGIHRYKWISITATVLSHRFQLLTHFAVIIHFMLVYIWSH